MGAQALTAEEVSKTSLDVLKALGINEVELEFSITELTYFTELALAGKVERVDTSDPAGGFGAVDLWAQTVVPAVAKALELRRRGTLSLPALDGILDEMIRRVGSPRARAGRGEVRQALCSALAIAAPPGTPGGSRTHPQKPS